LFIVTQFSNLYTAVDTPAEAAWLKLTLPARRVSTKMYCSSMRDAGGSVLCRYNDNADIAPPHLCSTSASSEAEALNV
jgi:hypothetical protein